MPCPKCLNGSMRIDPLDGDLMCVNCGYIHVVVMALSAGIPTYPRRKAERANISTDYYLTPYYRS